MSEQTEAMAEAFRIMDVVEKAELATYAKHRQISILTAMTELAAQYLRHTEENAMNEFNSVIADFKDNIARLRNIANYPTDEGQLCELKRCHGMLESLIRSIEDGPIPRKFKPLD